MVDSISSSTNASFLREAQLDKSADKQLAVDDVKSVNAQAAKSAYVSEPAFGLEDNASISDAAKDRFLKERDALRFARLAQRVEFQPDPERLARIQQLKAMVDSGRTQQYLNNINPGELADKLLESPVGAFLAKG